MTTYTIYLGSKPIVSVAGTEASYICYEAAKTIAKTVGKTADLVWDETGEVVAYYDPEADDSEVGEHEEPHALSF